MRCRAWPVGTKPQHSLGVATRVPRGHEIDNQVRSAVMGRWVRRRALGASPCRSWREVDHVASFLEFPFQGLGQQLGCRPTHATPGGISQSTRVVQPDGGMNRWLFQLPLTSTRDEQLHGLRLGLLGWLRDLPYILQYIASFEYGEAHNHIDSRYFPSPFPLRTPSLPP